MNIRIIGVLLISLSAFFCQAQKNKKKISKELVTTVNENAFKDIDLTKEVDAAKGSTVKIICSNQNLEIRRSSGDKVKITTKVQVSHDNTETNDQLLERFGINVRSLNNRIDISAQSEHGNTFFFQGPNDPRFHNNINLENIHIDGDFLPRKDKVKNEAMERIKQSHEDRAMQERDKERLQEDLALMQRDKERMHKDMEKLQKQLKADAAKLKRDQNEFKKLHKEKQNDEKFFFDGDINNMQGFKGLDNMKIWSDSLPGLMHMEVLKNLGADLENKMKNSFKFSFNTGQQSNLVVYVPEDIKLEIQNKFGNINFADDCKDANINISNGTVNGHKFGNLKLVSKFTTVNIGDVEDAEVEFENGNFTAGNIKQLDIDSKFSTIEIDNGLGMIIRSQNDNYNIESLEKLDGRKSYGTFRLSRLGKSFNLDGQNADLRIKNMTPSVDMVKINDRYADIRLPVKDLQNYSVNFNGKYSTVFGPFEKIVGKNSENRPEDHAANKSSVDGMYYEGARQNDQLGNHSPQIFTASVGDVKGTHTQFDLTCNQCTVDFK